MILWSFALRAHVRVRARRLGLGLGCIPTLQEGKACFSSSQRRGVDKHATDPLFTLQLWESSYF